MNFQNTEQIMNGKFYLDLAVQRSKRHVSSLTLKIKDDDKKAFLKESARVKVIKDSLSKSFFAIIHSFPGLDGLPEFYFELCRNSFDVDVVKQSLSAISWAPGKIAELELEFKRKSRGKSKSIVMNERKAFLGRVSSIVKRLNAKFDLLEHARRVLLSFPAIKEDLFTVCLTGFPNVGKSTLLSRITSSKPEIGSYAFTTKSLNTGYFKDGFEDIQVIDVPGSLNRFEKLNSVEKQAQLAIKYLANLVVFIFDLTEPYPLTLQESLFDVTKSFGKPLIIYFSKVDLLGSEVIEEFIKKKQFSDRCIFEFSDLRNSISSIKKEKTI